MQVRFVIRLKSVHRLDQSILGEDLRCLSVFCVVKSFLLSPPHSLTQSSSFLVPEHKSSSSACHLDPILRSAFHLPPRELSLLQLCHSCAPQGVLGSSSLAPPLWVQLYGPIGYVSVWSPQRVVNPTPNPLRSEPYRNTAFTFDPKNLNLVLVIRPPYWWSFSRVWMSSSAPPLLVTMLLRYMNSSTSSTCSPFIDTPSPRLEQIHISFEFVATIFRPSFAPCFSFVSCILCDSSTRSSAKSRSSKDFLKDHWIPRHLSLSPPPYCFLCCSVVLRESF